jgi:hypothetical protein
MFRQYAGLVTALHKRTKYTHSDERFAQSQEREGRGLDLAMASRSHLPLRGKLGWITHAPATKKVGKRNAFWALVPKQGPFLFSDSLNLRYPRTHFDSPQHWNSRLPQNMRDLRLFQA